MNRRKFFSRLAQAVIVAVTLPKLRAAVAAKAIPPMPGAIQLAFRTRAELRGALHYLESLNRQIASISPGRRAQLEEQLFRTRRLIANAEKGWL